MPRIFIIQDEFHGEWIREFKSRSAAVDFFHGLADVPWGTEPNVPPCMSSQDCCRWYVITEYETAESPWAAVETSGMLEVDAAGSAWRDWPRDSAAEDSREP